MTTLLDLYEYAENQGIDVDWIPLEQATSLSIPLPDGSYAIAPSEILGSIPPQDGVGAGLQHVRQFCQVLHTGPFDAGLPLGHRLSGNTDPIA